MKLSKKGYEFLGKEEGLRLTAYQDSVGVWTIGFGNTFYENGVKVKKGDKITRERADELFELIVKRFEDGVNSYLKVKVNQNQFDALLSLAYNIGLGAFKGSTVLKRVNANHNDPTIRQAIEMWKNAGGKPILLKRRQREADLYFTPVTGVQSKQTTTDLNLRTGAGTSNSVVEVLPKGTEVNVLSEKDGWVEVFVCSTKAKGWVSNNYLK